MKEYAHLPFLKIEKWPNSSNTSTYIYFVFLSAFTYFAFSEDTLTI